MAIPRRPHLKDSPLLLTASSHTVDPEVRVISREALQL